MDLNCLKLPRDRTHIAAQWNVHVHLYFYCGSQVGHNERISQRRGSKNTAYSGRNSIDQANIHADSGVYCYWYNRRANFWNVLCPYHVILSQMFLGWVSSGNWLYRIFLNIAWLTEFFFQVWYCQSTKVKATLWSVDLTEGSDCWNMLWKS